MEFDRIRLKLRSRLFFPRRIILSHMSHHKKTKKIVARVDSHRPIVPTLVRDRHYYLEYHSIDRDDGGERRRRGWGKGKGRGTTTTTTPCRGPSLLGVRRLRTGLAPVESCSYIACVTVGSEDGAGLRRRYRDREHGGFSETGGRTTRGARSQSAPVNREGDRTGVRKDEVADGATEEERWQQEREEAS